MNVYVLTSSRADYGIYLPLLKRLEEDPYFDLNIIAFGSHLSKNHGYTIDSIIKDGFKVSHRVKALPENDSAEAISRYVGDLQNEFSTIWQEVSKHNPLVFALGDRYEMFAAVAATVPFNLDIAHIHGGETTLGAIDNKYRHAITAMAKYHFTTTAQYKERVADMVGSDENVWNSGSISLENLNNMSLLNCEEFLSRWNIDMDISTVLFTFHPETVNTVQNDQHITELKLSLEEIAEQYQVVITMPNMDTNNAQFRALFSELAEEHQNIKCVESLGTLSYFSCMKLSQFLLGNTSSGIIEAASFGKYVINIGDRQKGRAQSKNIYNTAVSWDEIKKAIAAIENDPEFTGENIYQSANSATTIINALKRI